jgi:heme-degrading monooxygenase HmoA
MDEMMILELVRFKIKPDLAKQEFLSAAEQASEFLRRQHGFVKRRIYHVQANEWLDAVTWENLQAAQSAAANFQQDARCQEFMRCIDEVLSFEHLTEEYATRV